MQSGGRVEGDCSPEEWEVVREARYEYTPVPRDGGAGLAERFLRCGINIVKLVNKLPKTFAGTSH